MEATKTFRRKGDAEDWVKEREAEFLNGKSPNKDARTKTVADLIKASLAITKRDKPNSYKKKKERLSWWAAKLGSMKLFDVQASHICKAREALLEETCCRGTKRTTSTANRYMTDLRQAFQHGVERESWLQFNVVKQIKQLKEPPSIGKCLDRDTELTKVALACGRSRNKMLLPLFMLAVSLGLRKSSLVGLREEEVNLEKRTVRIPASRMKRDNMITLEVDENIMPFLKQAYDNRHPETRLLFPGKKDPSKPMDFDKAWENALKRAGVKDFRWHDLRHTAGTYFSDAGLPLHVIADLLGQKTLEMAKRYTHMSEARKAKVAPIAARTILADTAKAAAAAFLSDHPTT